MRILAILAMLLPPLTYAQGYPDPNVESFTYAGGSLLFQPRDYYTGELKITGEIQGHTIDCGIMDDNFPFGVTVGFDDFPPGWGTCYIEVEFIDGTTNELTEFKYYYLFRPNTPEDPRPRPPILIESILV